MNSEVLLEPLASSVAGFTDVHTLHGPIVAAGPQPPSRLPGMFAVGSEAWFAVWGRFVGVIVLSLLDHKKTWYFELKAEPSACVRAFADGLTSKSAVALMKAKWDVSSSASSGATATYMGRAGIAKMGSIMLRRAAEEEDAAIGSKLNFKVESLDQSTGRIKCSLWFSIVAKSMGFTADARFFRSYMHAVQSALQSLDPGMTVSKA